MNDILQVRVLPELRIGGGPIADQLQARALEHAGLAAADFLAVRDLLRLGNCDDPALQGLLMLLFMEYGNGSLCLRLTPEIVAAKLLQLTGEEQPELRDEIMAGLDDGRWSKLIGQEDSQLAPLQLRQMNDDQFLFFQKTWCHASELKTCIQARLTSEMSDQFAAADLTGIVADVVDGPGASFALNKEQQLALCLSLVRKLVVISGGPGTGKTSIILSLLRCMLRAGIKQEEIRLVAPTGRASQRITESLHGLLGDPLPIDQPILDLKGRTIHQLLGYNPTANRFKHNRLNRLPVKLLVVDEVSMVDVSLMARLLAAVPDDAHIVFLGDKDQLPSVDAGAVLADLIPTAFPESFSAQALARASAIRPGLQIPAPSIELHSLSDTIVILKTCYRSEQHILRAAKKVNEQRPDAVQEFQLAAEAMAAKVFREGVSGPWRIEVGANDKTRFRGILDQWAMNMFLDAGSGVSYLDLVRSALRLDFHKSTQDLADCLDQLMAQLRGGQILAFVRQGERGIHGINRYLDRECRRVMDPHSLGDTFAGSPIMIQRNDHAKGLYNGDLGVVLRDKNGNLRAFFSRLGGYVDYAVESLPPHELAFAVTVHKSQGSEYDRVLLILPARGGHRMLCKEILYTGMTRAKSSVVVVGENSVFEAAVGRRIERETGVSLWGQAPEPRPQPVVPEDDDDPQLKLFDF